MKLIFATTLIASGLLAGQAIAQTSPTGAGMAPGAASSTAPMRTGTPTVGRSAKSLDCSAQADKQGLHGKARKAFRNKCKHG